MRHALAFSSTLLVACTTSAAPGALRVHGVPGQGTLYLDGVDRGAIQTVQLLEPLAPRIYALELRHGGTPVFLQTVEVRPGMVLDVRVEASTVVVASPSRVRNAPSASPHLDPPTEPAAPPEIAHAELATATGPTVRDAPPVEAPPRRHAASRRTDRVARARPGDAELESLLLRALEEDAAALPARDAERAAARDAEGTAAFPELPETPSRADVQRAMGDITAAVHACMGSEHGSMTIASSFAGATGRPTSVTIGGVFAGTPVGACAEGAARTARLPRFRRPTFEVRFPFAR